MKDDISGMIRDFTAELDRFFASDDMRGAGEYLRTSLAKAGSVSFRSFRLTVLNEMMGYYRKTGEKNPGLDAVRQCISLLEEMGNADTVGGATVLLNAATTLNAFGKPAEALSLYEKAESVYSRHLSPVDIRFAALCNNLALTLTALHRYDDAEIRYHKALFILSQASEKYTDIANTYVNMAYLYEIKERYEDIETCMSAAETALNTDRLRNAYYAYTCRKCAPAFGHFGYFLTEKELNERADRIYAGH